MSKAREDNKQNEKQINLLIKIIEGMTEQQLIKLLAVISKIKSS